MEITSYENCPILDRKRNAPRIFLIRSLGWSSYKLTSSLDPRPPRINCALQYSKMFCCFSSAVLCEKSYEFFVRATWFAHHEPSGSGEKQYVVPGSATSD